MKRLASSLGLTVLFALAVPACGDGGTPDELTLDDFLPDDPVPDGTAQSVWAGEITQAKTAELIDGPAATGLVGDYYMRNSRARFVIQSEMRSIGVSPWGGNLIDATGLDAAGADLAGDSLGEISMVYLVGRTCAHETIEVVLDGSGGGPAVIRARGRSNINDYVNLKAIGAIGIPPDLDPDIGDSIECATTYTLRPDQETIEIAWTMFNAADPADPPVAGPFGMINDCGGEMNIFYPRQRLYHIKTGFEVLATASAPNPLAYAVYQAPDIAYGVIPRHDKVGDSGPLNAAAIIAGVNAVVFGVDSFLDILNSDFNFMSLAGNDGVTYRAVLAVGLDAADIEASYDAIAGVATTPVSGAVGYAPSGEPGSRARVGVYLDTNGDAALDDEDKPLTYFDADAAGNWSGALPAGNYFLRADVKDVARSAVIPFAVSGTTALVADPLSLPEAGRFDYTFVDDETGATIPGRITVVGRSPIAPDLRVHEVVDRHPGVIRTLHAPHGTSVGVAPGDPVDPPLFLPAGGPYKLFASHGPEWSYASVALPAVTAGTQTLELRLRRVLDTTGYLATEFHQHSFTSPDSAVNTGDRLASLAAEGIEFFASTDHDYIFDYDPLIDEQQLRGVIDAAVGIEATPFAFGHFQAYPLTVDPMHPAHGAVDWAQGMAGFAMLPSELWGALRGDRGARIIQVNHPRSLLGFDFQSYFTRAGLVYDFDQHMLYGDPAEMPVPLDWLRLPDTGSIFSTDFDALEVWNGVALGDSDLDGVREIQSLDLVLRDYMNLTSFGVIVAPLGNSDTHTYEKDAAGMPRSFVRVSDDSPAGLVGGLDEEVWGQLEDGHDVVVTNGPMLQVTTGAGAAPAIGAIVDGTGGPVDFTVVATSADWVQFDTIEVFVSSTFDPVDDDVTFLTPTMCFTSRDPLAMMPTDPCLAAPLGGAQAMTVTQEAVGGGYNRSRAEVTFTLAAGDAPVRAGATGEDVWVMVRVRGQKAVFPVLVDALLDDGPTLDAVLTGNPTQLDAALMNRGVPAAAFTAATLVDFDGSGWRAPFAP